MNYACGVHKHTFHRCQMFADHFMHVHTYHLLVIPACLRFTLQQQWWVRDLEGKQLFRAKSRCASFTPAWSRIHLVLELSVSTGILKYAFSIDQRRQLGGSTLQHGLSPLTNRQKNTGRVEWLNPHGRMLQWS